MIYFQNCSVTHFMESSSLTKRDKTEGSRYYFETDLSLSNFVDIIKDVMHFFPKLNP